jgi:putative endonuclease
MPTNKEPQAEKQEPATTPARKLLGDRAEALVAEHFERQGWEIVGRNVRVGHYELDLVAVDQRTAVVMEVRTRGPSAFTTAIGSIDAAKRRHLRSAASRIWRTWFKKRPDIDNLRFDVAAVSFATDGTVTIEHIKAAFS